MPLIAVLIFRGFRCAGCVLGPYLPLQSFNDVYSNDHSSSYCSVLEKLSAPRDSNSLNVDYSLEEEEVPPLLHSQVDQRSLYVFLGELKWLCRFSYDYYDGFQIDIAAS